MSKSKEKVTYPQLRQPEPPTTAPQVLEQRAGMGVTRDGSSLTIHELVGKDKRNAVAVYNLSRFLYATAAMGGIVIKSIDGVDLYVNCTTEESSRLLTDLSYSFKWYREEEEKNQLDAMKSIRLYESNIGKRY